MPQASSLQKSMFFAKKETLINNRTPSRGLGKGIFEGGTAPSEMSDGVGVAMGWQGLRASRLKSCGLVGRVGIASYILCALSTSCACTRSLRVWWVECLFPSLSPRLRMLGVLARLVLTSISYQFTSYSPSGYVFKLCQLAIGEMN